MDFLKSTILAAGRPAETSLAEAYWKGALDTAHDASLKQAVDLAASRVESAFQNQMVAEVMAREIIGTVYLNLGEPRQAFPQFEKAFEMRAALHGFEAAETARCRNRLAIAYRLAGRAADASRLFEQRTQSEAYSEAIVVQGKLLLSRKKPAEAELKFRQCLNYRQVNAPREASTFEVQSLLGAALVEQHKFEQAETHLLAAYEGLGKLVSDGSSLARQDLITTAERLTALYLSWGRAEKAEQWMRELESINVSAEPAPSGVGAKAPVGDGE